ncbi:transposon Tf2-6 polyprotein [Trichonephila clavipes]|nr:transposon Tf2-6 polyprotein [Trichonephila clavipes]
MKQKYIIYCRTHKSRYQVPIAELAERWTELPQVSDESRSFFRVHTGYFSNIPKCIKAEFIASWACSQSSVVSSSQPEVDEIAKFLLEEIVLRHGAPRVIITDHWSRLSIQTCFSLVDLCNIDHRFTTAYHPQTNGLTERFNKTLADMLSMYVDVEQKNWDEILPFVTFAYKTAKQETTAARAEESRQLARVHTLRAQDKDRRRYDSKHQMVSYAPGISYGFILQKLREVVHVLRMKPYHDPAEQIETEDIPPKESYKGPITRSRIKTLEQNESGALSSFRGEQCRTHKSRYQVPIAELAERWTELPQVSATRGLLTTDHVNLNYGQVTWTTRELAPSLLTTTPHQREDVSVLDRFNVHLFPTPRVFSGIGFELVTRQATITYTTWLPRPHETDGTIKDMHKRRSNGPGTSTSELNPLGLDSFTRSSQNSTSQCASKIDASSASVGPISQRAKWKVYIPQLLHTLNEDDPDD